MNRIGQLLILLSLLLVLSPAALAARIEISSPGQQSIPLALTSFLPAKGSKTMPELALEIRQVLEADLDLSGLFDLIDPKAFLADARRSGLLSSQVDFAEWRLLGAEALVKGSYRVEGDRVQVDVRLFDTLGRRMLTGRRYAGKIKDVRRIAHTFADQVLKELTEESGPFNAKIAFISNRSGRKELYLSDVDGKDVVRLTDHRSIVLNPDFSPIGKELIYTSYKNGEPHLYRKEIYTGKEARISRQKGLNIGGRYRFDGREIALSLSRDGNSELYLIGASGSIHRRLTNSSAIDVDPSWSPDGDQIVFVSNRQGNPHLFIIDTAGGKKIRRLSFRGTYNASPSWSPKGDRILFSRLEGNRFDLFSIRPDGSDEQRLTFGAGSKEHPRWSPDGRFVTYTSDQDGKKAIFVMRADGTGNRRITDAGVDSIHPVWSGPWK